LDKLGIEPVCEREVGAAARAVELTPRIITRGR
jgi:hypothetical protein